jgi:hypothetical protein
VNIVLDAVWCKSLHSIEDRDLGVRDFYASDLRVGLLNRILQSLLPQEALSCCMASTPDTADLTRNLVTNTDALFYCLCGTRANAFRSGKSRDRRKGISLAWFMEVDPRP